jgi:hypothetical protein
MYVWASRLHKCHNRVRIKQLLCDSALCMQQTCLLLSYFGKANMTDFEWNTSGAPAHEPMVPIGEQPRECQLTNRWYSTGMHPA